MYFLAKNIRTCSRSFRGTQSTLLYKNGALNWDYLAKNASFFMMHPEQLKQKLKERDAHMLCRFFDSEEYQKKVKSFLEMQSKFLARDPLAAPRHIKYQHVLSCAQPSHKKQKRVTFHATPKMEIKVNEPKVKIVKKGTIIGQLMKRKMERIKEADDASLNHDRARKRMRHKTTIMPIFLKKMKKKHVEMRDGLFSSVYRVEASKREVSTTENPEPLYTKIIHKSNINLRDSKSGNEPKGYTYFADEPHTLIFEGEPYAEPKFDLNTDSKSLSDKSNTLTFEGTTSYKAKDSLADEVMVEEVPFQNKRPRYIASLNDNEDIEVNPQAYKVQAPTRKSSFFDPHTLTFEGDYCKKPEILNRKKLKVKDLDTYDKKSYKVQNRLEQDEDSSSTDKRDKYPPQKSYKASSRQEINDSKVENSISRAENFKGDPTPADGSSYKFSNFSAKVDHVPYRLSRVNSKYENVSFKLGGPSKSNVAHIPLRMSSSTARVIQRGATTKLCPKKNENLKRKSFSELLCLEPTKLRTSRSMKSNKVQGEPDAIVKVEVVKKSLGTRKGKGDGEETGEGTKVTSMQMLLDNVYKTRSLNLEDNLERKHTLVAMLRDRDTTDEKTQLEVPSLFEKVKMGFLSNLAYTVGFLYTISFEILKIILFLIVSFLWFLANVAKLSSKESAIIHRYLIRLPKTTPEGYRVLMYAVRDPDPTKMNFTDVVKGFCMYNDCVLSEDGLQEGYVVIFDMKDVGIGHLARVSLPALKCFMYYIQDAHPCRLKQIHVLNTASWIHHVMRLVVPLVRSEMLNLVRFHKGNIPDNFPVEVLPMDYGGEAPLVEDLDNTTKSLLGKYRNWLVETSEFKADESKRIKKGSWWGLFSPKSPQQNELDEKTILRNLQID